MPGEARPLVTGNGHPPLALSNSFAFGGHNVALALRGAAQMSATALGRPGPFRSAAVSRWSAWRRCAIPAPCACCARGPGRRGWATAPSPATASSAPPGPSTAARSPATRRTGTFLGGSLGERHADTIVRVLSTAQRARIPVVGFVESGGARMQEGTAALAGYGRIFRETVALTGVVPQISIVSGASAGGGAYSPALTDLIVMTQDAAMFLTGPGVVREALGEEIDAAGLGGPSVHDRNGVCHLVERDEAAAAARVRELLSYLPSAAGQPRRVAARPRPRAGPRRVRPRRVPQHLRRP